MCKDGLPGLLNHRAPKGCVCNHYQKLLLKISVSLYTVVAGLDVRSRLESLGAYGRTLEAAKSNDIVKIDRLVKLSKLGGWQDLLWAGWFFDSVPTLKKQCGPLFE